MKIGIIGKFGPEEMGKYISNALKKENHEVFEFEFGPFLNQTKNNKLSNILFKIRRKIFEIGIVTSKKNRAKLLEKFLKNIEKTGNFDLIISTYDYLTFLEIDRLKEKTGANFILWFPDALVNIGRSFFMTAGYDYLFFKCNHIVSQLRNYYQLNAYYLAEAFEKVDIEKIDENKEYEEIDIAIVGNLHSSRVPILEKLVALQKYKIKIYGTKSPFYLPVSDELRKCFTGKYLVGKEKIELFKNAKINLNTLHIGEVESVNVRTFEIAGAQGFQLVSYREEVGKLFEIGKELDTFKTFEELIEKIDYYLEKKELRKKIAKNSYENCIKNYTYKKRIEEILCIIGAEKKGV